MAIHDIIDPLWRSGAISRKTVYQAMSERLGREYHTAEIRSLDEANAILIAAREYAAKFEP
jgi:hypothetical protein